MVKTIIKEMYVCPYCRSKHDSEYEAYNCARECVILDDIDTLAETVYLCEVCNKEHDKRLDASNCQDGHASGNDHKYQAYLEEKEREKLLKAAKHHAQTKLIK